MIPLHPETQSRPDENLAGACADVCVLPVLTCDLNRQNTVDLKAQVYTALDKR